MLRKTRMISGLLVIVLGIGAVVGILTVTRASNRAVSAQLDALGANILVLPQGASVSDYYAADIDSPVFPESYATRVVTSMIPGVDNTSPKLSRRMTVGGVAVVLTGIVPASEAAAKPMWQRSVLTGADLPAGCAPVPAAADGKSGCPPAKPERMRIENLGRTEALVGAAAARRLRAREGGSVVIAGKTFSVSRVLPETGTVDDGRIFIHLRSAQELLGAGRVVSAIEIMGCCSAISEGLLGKLRNILPDTRIVTINHIVSAQVGTNRLMARVSVVLALIILVVGSLSMANVMWANVEERKKELGTLITVGFGRRDIYLLLFSRAAALGLVGGVLGYLLGTATAMLAGPWIADLRVVPVAAFLALSVGLAVGISVLGCWLPARGAARLEPAAMMQDP